MKYIKTYVQLIKESNVHQIFYHGTNKKLNSLNIMQSESGESRFLGDGIYVSNNPNICKEYGTYVYEVVLTEDYSPLRYFTEIPLIECEYIIDKFRNSNNDDLEYLADGLEEKIEDNDLPWGKYFIADLERNDLDVNNTLILCGYNAIEAPINKMNAFIGYPDTDLNINIIKDGIVQIKEI